MGTDLLGSIGDKKAVAQLLPGRTTVEIEPMLQHTVGVVELRRCGSGGWRAVQIRELKNDHHNTLPQLLF